MKDPAFLFYSKDFYEGTRMMLPEERACYIDLMVYQHQNGTIPLNTKRLLMYCSGVDEATLISTLEAKFIKTENGWENNRLKKEIDNRESYKNDLSLSGKIGQFWKKAKNFLSSKEYNELKKSIEKQEVIEFLNKNKTIDEATLKGLLKRCLSNKANGDVNEDEDIEKGGAGGKTEPDLKLPWKTENFKAQWKLYKVFRKKKHKFSFLNTDSENRALKELQNLSGNNEKAAMKIIEQSIDKGWKGLFSLSKDTAIKPDKNSAVMQKMARYE